MVKSILFFLSQVGQLCIGKVINFLVRTQRSK
jgi:hypothetical protein